MNKKPLILTIVSFIGLGSIMYLFPGLMPGKNVGLDLKYLPARLFSLGFLIGLVWLIYDYFKNPSPKRLEKLELKRKERERKNIEAYARMMAKDKNFRENEFKKLDDYLDEDNENEE